MAAGVLALTFPVWAQSAKPMPLLAPQRAPSPAPVTSAPLEAQPLPPMTPLLPPGVQPQSQSRTQPQPQEQTQAPADPAATAKPGEASVLPVTGGSLPPVDPESLGVLSESNGGFGVTLWAETRRDAIEALLPRLPAALVAPSLQSLQRRLLLSIAPMPESPKPGMSLMQARVGRLMAMGDLAGAVELIRSMPARAVDSFMAETRADALLIDDDIPAACQEARQRLASTPGLYWDKLNVFCDLTARDMARAQLGATMARDQGDRDAAFFTLTDALSGNKKAQVKSLPDATPLTLAMMRAAGQPLPADTGPRDKPAILRGIALTPNAPASQRLEAAHRAALYGALAADELARMFEQTSFAPAQLASAFSEAVKLPAAQARALLYRAAKAETRPQGRAETLRALYALGRQDGDFALLARVTRKLLLEMPASRDQAWFAADAARALYSTRDLPAAKGWLDAAQAASANDRDAAAASVAIWPLARLADGDAAAAWDADKLAQWRGAAEAGKADSAPPRSGAALALLDAVGDPVIGADWQALFKGPTTVTGTIPSPMAWFGLRAAASEKRVGLTVLYVLTALGETDLGKQNPITVGAAVQALKAAGLERDARALAVDAAIAAGL